MEASYEYWPPFICYFEYMKPEEAHGALNIDVVKRKDSQVTGRRDKTLTV